MKTERQHEHEFKVIGKSGIRKCYCGAWRHKEGAEAIIAVERQQGHTPTPYRLTDDQELKGKHPLHNKRFLVADDSENEGEELVIAKFTDGIMADRDFVLKAVNSHDALVEALKASKALLEMIEAQGMTALESQYADETVNVINDALASAGVKI